MNSSNFKYLVILFLLPSVLGRPSPDDSQTIVRNVRSPFRGSSQSSQQKKMPHDYKSVCGISGARAVRSFTPQFKILNGTCAPYGSLPWTVQIQILDDGSSYSHHCGGTIITEDFILTAAHCFPDGNFADIRIVVGQGILNVPEEEEMVFEIENVELHPGFDSPKGSFNNDLALLKIQRKGDGGGIRLSNSVAPACLPRDDTPQKSGTECTVSGWGKTEEKMEISKDSCMRSAIVPIVEDNQCRTWYTESNAALTNGMMCAGYEDGGIDACLGDSGGPLACNNEGRYYITGVVSWGRGCGERRKPGIYTRVKNYLDWIDGTISKMHLA